MPTSALIILGTISLLAGLVAGFAVMDPQLRGGLRVALKSVVRIVRKTVARANNSGIDLARVQRDEEFIAFADDMKASMADTKALQVTYDLKQRLQQQYGHQLTAVYLFGSRARGDHCPDSDVDVALFFEIDKHHYSGIVKAILHHTSELLLESGLYIQTRLFESTILQESRASLDDYLARVVLSYGILV